MRKTHVHACTIVNASTLLPPSQNPQCHRRVKPHILSAVGDVALATGQAFKPQLEVVLKILQEAANAEVDRVSERSWEGLERRGGAGEEGERAERRGEGREEGRDWRGGERTERRGGDGSSFPTLVPSADTLTGLAVRKGCGSNLLTNQSCDS